MCVNLSGKKRNLIYKTDQPYIYVKLKVLECRKYVNVFQLMFSRLDVNLIAKTISLVEFGI